MSAFNSSTADIGSSVQQATVLPPPTHAGNTSVVGSNYPLVFDPTGMQGSSSFANPISSGKQGDTTGTSSGSVIDDPVNSSVPHSIEYSSLSSTTLQLPSHVPGTVRSNGPSFMNGSLSSHLGSLPSNMHMPSVQGNHAHMRPYMMFGIPGLPEQRVLYDDQIQIPPPPAMGNQGGGNWLRIRQPIDYVAPLKKPMNSFLLYSAERRVQLRQTHPDLNTTQQSTILAREWAALQEDEKEKYRAEAKQLRDDYNARRAELSLKLQQQLNQQHLNIGLAQGPPPPSHPPALDLLDVNLCSNIQDGHMHRVGQFGNSGGFQPHFAGTSGFHMPQSVPFNPTTPGNIRWKEFSLTSADQDYHRPTSPRTQYQQSNILRPTSNVSQYIHHDSQQRQNDTQSYSANLVHQGFLDTAHNIFNNPFDSILKASELDTEKTPQDTDKTAILGSFADFGALGSANNGMNLGNFGQLPVKPTTPGRQNTASVLDSGTHSYSKNQTSESPGDVRDNTASSKRGARLSSPAKRTRKKSRKDPDAPKHPMSAFLYYLTSERPRLAEHLGDMSIGQQTKIIAKQWKTLTENDRAPWEKLAKHDKDRYARERREYHGETRHADTPATAI
ncbi:High mobility group [Coemansia interrupta]|uniref:High mobility group n=1 Tax=Coemansia interrupta TaxID=1126814 RepID=A0A9W8H4T3_9FUNG|nr:High mobility group [Coemansia interrupta]